MRESDSEMLALYSRMAGDPSRRVVHRSSLLERTRDDGYRRGRAMHPLSTPQEVDAKVRLFAKPRIAVPDAAGHERIVIARYDKYRTSVMRALEDWERPRGVASRDGVVVEHVAGDNDEIDALLGRLVANPL